MNIPVPPIFLYEKNLGKFEVMDGQQRLNAIAEFWRGNFALQGLEIWEALNGRTYSQLPPLVRRGLERAKISSITLMSDTSGGEENSLDLRAQVFERLNTGGEQLLPQELRNSLYSGSFNDLLIDLSKTPEFTSAWGIPDHEEHTREDGTVDKELEKHRLYRRMIDVEIVLRFFAFQSHDRISGSVRSMLDNTMKLYRHADEEKIAELRQEFLETLALAKTVFGDDIFRLPDQEDGKPGKQSRPLYDAEMAALYRLKGQKTAIENAGAEIVNRVMALADPNAETYDLMVGRGNTAATIKKRIETVQGAIAEVIGDDQA